MREEGGDERTRVNGGEDAQIPEEGIQGGDQGGSGLVSHSYCDEPSPTRCLERTDKYTLTVLEDKSLKLVSRC